jgi:hypothetical protein
MPVRRACNPCPAAGSGRSRVQISLALQLARSYRGAPVPIFYIVCYCSITVEVQTGPFSGPSGSPAQLRPYQLPRRIKAKNSLRRQPCLQGGAISFLFGQPWSFLILLPSHPILFIHSFTVSRQISSCPEDTLFRPLLIKASRRGCCQSGGDVMVESLLSVIQYQ